LNIAPGVPRYLGIEYSSRGDLDTWGWNIAPGGTWILGVEYSSRGDLDTWG